MNRPSRADLHIHTTASDGDLTPSQVVLLGIEAGLKALAITDHDTLAAVPEAIDAAGNRIEVIAGVEISAAFESREVHLLGYFVRLDHTALQDQLARVQRGRNERFHHIIALLAGRGVPLPQDRVKLVEQSSTSLGRRHVARLLVSCGFARSITEAFHRHIGSASRQAIPKVLVPVEEAIALIRAAGGVASLAHPSPDLDEDAFGRLAHHGLAAVEAEYPWGRTAPATRLREIAARLGLAVSGGSDCHGLQPAHRRIGSHAIDSDSLEQLRNRCGVAAPARMTDRNEGS
jgi:predicted metal-dependent phosphoesterase TrpH